MARRDLKPVFWQVASVGGVEGKFVRQALWEPRVDVLESESQYVIRVELAGVSAEGLALTYVPVRHSLLLQGTRPETRPDDPHLTACHQLEVYYGPFEREIALPPIPVTGEGIHATYVDGMLTVYVPKASRAERNVTLRVRKV
ncbi:MAG TPA: Hsp20/alpha crystallin family protein [Fimbriimonadaceae bacterium]|nr:Hsp20/alpha crystallin family protein [Fimbriimonadaceae bacterium]